PCKIRLVHVAGALNNDAINRADFMWKNHDRIADGHIVDRNIMQSRSEPAMSSRWHPSRKSREHRACAPRCELLKDNASRKHQDDKGACQILTEENRGRYGYACQYVGPELTANDPEREIPYE